MSQRSVRNTGDGYGGADYGDVDNGGNGYYGEEDNSQVRINRYV